MKTAAIDIQQAGSQAKSLIYVVFLASTVAISGFLFGFNTAVINGVLVFVRRQFVLNNSEIEALASALLLGGLLGAAGASLIGDRLGRRKSLLLSAGVFVAATLSTALATSALAFSAGRFALGLAIGVTSVLTPVYIAEIAPANNRGMLVSLNQLALVVGILVSYLVGWGLSGLGEGSWRWMVGAAEIPSLLFLFGLLAIPESPRWLIAQGQRDKGREVLARIYGVEAAEAQAIQVEKAGSCEQGSWSEVFSKPMRKPLTIALGLAILCQVTGINAVLYYGSILIAEHFPGQTTATALASSVIIGAANLVATLVAMRFLDRWGRRPMLLTASGGMAIALAALVVEMRAGNLPSFILLASILLYVGFFAFGMGPVPWVVISEIFPNKIRGRAASVATSVLWTGTLLVTLTFLSLLRVLGVAGTFALFAILSAFSFGFVLKCVPETQGKSLEQIQDQWRA